MAKIEYDYLIVGAGLYGAMSAYILSRQGKKCLVIDKNHHIGGLCYTEKSHGIEVHKFGAHIFRTNSRKVWDFVNSICEFIPFVNSPLACHHGNIYNLPFNMNTFKQVFGVLTPLNAKAAIESDKRKCASPSNLEENAKAQIGERLYEMFIRDYTEKQWGKKCSELPVSIMKRIPIRYTYNNNYYTERYQGIPECGYTEFTNRLLDGVKVMCDTDFFGDRNYFSQLANKIIYTGTIDQFYDYCFGKLDYRSVKFKQIYLSNIDNLQGNAVMNYTDLSVPYTRRIEHKHFMNAECKGTVISYEIPVAYDGTNNPAYPIPTADNLEKYARYKELADNEANVIFGGRLAEYKYYSMNDIIEHFI